MKYLHLIWAALFRRKTRTFLTLASIAAAFLLFGLLDGIRTSFAQLGQNADGAQRLQTASKLSFIETLPLSLQSRIAGVDNIEAVTHANWFGGAYQNPRNQLFTFAVAPNYLELYPETEVDPAQLEKWKATRNGILLATRTRDLEQAGKDRAQAVSEAAVERLAPILMTAVTAALGLLPLGLALGQPGSEIQAPMALVILTGLASSTVLNMLVIPPLLHRFGGTHSPTADA